ncbi:MAG: invasin domain 3-containing protein [Thermoplasmatota archaeon]
MQPAPAQSPATSRPLFLRKAKARRTAGAILARIFVLTFLLSGVVSSAGAIPSPAAPGQNGTPASHAVPWTSLLLASPSAVAASPTTSVAIVVVARDVNASPVGIGGDTVCVWTTLGQISSSTGRGACPTGATQADDRKDGTYNATLSGASRGRAKLTASIDDLVLDRDAEVLFLGPAFGGIARIHAANDTIIADGKSKTFVTVQAVDSNGDPRSVGGDVVCLNSSFGSLVSTRGKGVCPFGIQADDSGTGTYNATLVSTSALRFATISGSINGQMIGHNATVHFGGPAVAAASSLEVHPGSVAADGKAAGVIFVLAMDENGTPTLVAGATVCVTASLGTISSTLGRGACPAGATQASLVGSWPYEVTLASTQAGASVVNATINGAPVPSSAIAHLAGPASATMSAIVPDVPGALGTIDSYVPADGTTLVPIRVDAYDAAGYVSVAPSVLLCVHTTLGTLSSASTASCGPTATAAQDQGDGTYLLTLRAPAGPGVALLTATLNGAPMLSNSSISFGSAANAAESQIRMVGDLPANPAQAAPVTVRSRAPDGEPVFVGGAVVCLGSTAGTLSSTAKAGACAPGETQAVDQGNGLYSASFAPSATAGDGTIYARMNDAILPNPREVFFHGTASANTSVLESVAADPSVPQGFAERGEAFTGESLGLRVTARDPAAQSVSIGGSVICVATTIGTVTSTEGQGKCPTGRIQAQDLGNGMYNATFTAPSTTGFADVTMTVDGAASPQTATIAVYDPAGDLSAAGTYVDGFEPTAVGQTVTVTAHVADANGVAKTTGGDTVCIRANLGTLSSTKGAGSCAAGIQADDQGNGQYTATLTSQAPGPKTLDVAVNGVVEPTSTTSQFIGPAAGATTLFVQSGTFMYDDPSNAQTILLTSTDALGNDLLFPTNDVVCLTTTIGTLSSGPGQGSCPTGEIQADYDGAIFYATLGADAAGVAVVSATVNGAPAAGSLAVPIVGPDSQTSNFFSFNDATLPADGKATTELGLASAFSDLPTVSGDYLQVGGAVVCLTTSLGTLTSRADQGACGKGFVQADDRQDGTYYADLHSPAFEGVAIVNGTMNGVPMPAAWQVSFVGPLDAAASYLSIRAGGSDALPADGGQSSATVTLSTFDSQDNALASSTPNLVACLTTDLGALVSGAGQGSCPSASQVQADDNGDGTYSATLNSPRTEGEAIVNATVNGVPVGLMATFDFSGPASASTATITPSDANPPVGEEVTLDIAVSDASGFPSVGGSDLVCLQTNAGKLWSNGGTYECPGGIRGDYVGDGTYEVGVTSYLPGPVVVSGTLNGVPLAAPATVTFAGPLSPATSTVTLARAVLPADGATTTIVSVHARDANGNDLPGSMVTPNLCIDTDVGQIDSTYGSCNVQATGSAGISIGSTHVAGELVAPSEPGFGTVTVTTDDAQGTLFSHDATFTATGPADSQTTTLVTSAATLLVDGPGTNVTVALADRMGSPVPESGHSVCVATSLGTLTSIAARGACPVGSVEADSTTPGIFTVVLVPGTTPGTAVLNATLDGAGLRQSTTVSIAAGPAATLAPTVAGLSVAGQAAGATVPLAILATDAFGNTAPGASVAWQVVRGNATLRDASARTDGHGLATANVSTSARAGTTVVNVTLLAPGAPTRSFTITTTAGKPARLVAEVGTGTAHPIAGSVVTVAAELTDANGNPISGDSVCWTIRSGAGSLDAVSSTTGPDGVASANLTTSTVVGSVVVEASRPGASGPSLTFSLTTLPGPVEMVRSTSDPLPLTVAAGQSERLAVNATDRYGNPVAGVPVDWLIASGNGTLSNEKSTTNATGIAETNLTATLAGSTLVRAYVPGVVAPAAISVTIAAGPGATLNAVSPTEMSNVSAGAKVPLVTLVKDASGNAVGGVSVSWTLAKGIGNLDRSTSRTDGQGYAWNNLTTGQRAGTSTVEVTAGSLQGSPLTFSIGTIAGPPASIVANGPSTFSGVIVGATQMLEAQVLDGNGNPVSGASVEWFATAGGGSMNATSTKTNEDGIAYANLTAGLLVGSNDVTAVAATNAGAFTTVFTVATAPGPVAKIAPATGTTNVPITPGLPAAVSVLLTDANGNPAPGVTVSWKIASGNATLSAGSTTTDAHGIATVTVTSGIHSALGTIVATATALPGANVTLTLTTDVGGLGGLASKTPGLSVPMVLLGLAGVALLVRRTRPGRGRP